MKEWASKTFDRLHGSNGFYWGLFIASVIAWDASAFLFGCLTVLVLVCLSGDQLNTR